MITVLPPELREQLRYSKLNVRLLRYLILVGLLFMAIAGIGIVNHSYADNRIAELETGLAQKRQLTDTHRSTKQSVEDFKTKLKAVQSLFNNSTHFSVLLQDIADVLPSGTYITSIVLTGDDKKPLQILVNVDTFDKGAIIRNALAESKRIKTVDIQTITKNDNDPGYTVDIVLAFEEGQAR